MVGVALLLVAGLRPSETSGREPAPAPEREPGLDQARPSAAG
jgi:hypothetical protein